MSNVLSTVTNLQLRKSADPVCLLWGFTPAQIHFLSQILGVSNISFTTSLSSASSNLKIIIAAGPANLSCFPPTITVIRVSFCSASTPLYGDTYPHRGTSKKPPGLFYLPSQSKAFLTQVDQYGYPIRGQIINVFGLQAQSGVSTIAFCLANSVTDSIFVDASCPFSNAVSSPYAAGLQKIGFRDIATFSSRDLEDDVLVSRLRRVLPSIQNTRYLQLSPSSPQQISHLFSLLTRTFSLTVVDWGQIFSPRSLTRLPGQALLVQDVMKSPGNHQLLMQLRHERITIVKNRAPNRVFIGKNRNRDLLLPYYRELKRLQAQGLGAYLPQDLQTRIMRLLPRVLAGNV